MGTATRPPLYVTRAELDTLASVWGTDPDATMARLEDQARAGGLDGVAVLPETFAPRSTAEVA